MFNRQKMRFRFTEYEPEAFLTPIRNTIDQYHKADNWKKFRTNAIKEDFSWDRSAKSYLKLYRSTQQAK